MTTAFQINTTIGVLYATWVWDRFTALGGI